jgi:restriction system protein
MKLEMHKNSLFAILMRSPFWLSFAIAAGVFLLARLFLPEIYALFVPLPFVVVGCIAAWKQLRAPSETKVADAVAVVRDLAWADFAAVIEESYRADGFTVTRIDGAADFELVKAGRKTLVAAKRWKAARIGIEPLRELVELRKRREAFDCAFVLTGEPSENAAKYAVDHNVRLLRDADLVRFARR